MNMQVIRVFVRQYYYFINVFNHCDCVLDSRFFPSILSTPVIYKCSNLIQRFSELEIAFLYTHKKRYTNIKMNFKFLLFLVIAVWLSAVCTANDVPNPGKIYFLNEDLPVYSVLFLSETRTNFFRTKLGLKQLIERKNSTQNS